MLFRIAPTPSGFLHIGNACNALLSYRLALRHHAKLLLRIDDLDTERKKPAYLNDIFETLDWLGIEWELGPIGPDDFEQNWSQQHRRHLYEAMMTRLVATEQVYACALSRAQLKALATEQCRALYLPLDARDVAWRIKTPNEQQVISDVGGQKYTLNLYDVMPDFVVRRRDGIAAYQVASLADDLYFGVTHVVRGQDLLPSTAAQLFLADLLDEVLFKHVSWFHHPLITDINGEKLSKSAGALALQYQKNSATRNRIEDIVNNWLA